MSTHFNFIHHVNCLLRSNNCLEEVKIVPARTHLFRRLSVTDSTFISSSGRILQCTGLAHGMYTTENRFAINSFFTRFVLYYIVNDTENSPMSDKQNICRLQATDLFLSQFLITKFDKLRHSQFLGNTRLFWEMVDNYNIRNEKMLVKALSYVHVFL